MFTEKQTSADEFERVIEQPPYDQGLYELIDGEIVQKMPNEQHGLIQLIIGAALVAYWRRVGKGRPGSEVLHRVPGDPHNARQPDLSFFVDPVHPLVTQGAVSLLPDLAIEIQFPSNTVNEMRSQAAICCPNSRCRSPRFSLNPTY